MPHKRYNASTPPPHTQASEKAVLGVLVALSDFPGYLEKVRHLLNPASFFDPCHQEIYRAILELDEAGHKIDPMVLITHLSQAGKLEKVGGPAYITGLLPEVINPDNITFHADIVRGDALRRYTYAKLQAISDTTFDQTIPPMDLASKISELVDELAHLTSTSRTATSADLAQRAYDRLVHDPENKNTGVPSGLPRLDRLTNGWQPGNLIAIGARPSVGKTALALQMALNAVKHGIGTIFFSLEMTHNELTDRLIAIGTGISLTRIRHKTFSEKDLCAIGKFLENLKTWPLYIEDNPDVDDNAIRSRANLLIAQHPEIRFMVLDYLQLMDADRNARRNENRNLELGRFSRTLKKIAGSLGIPVVVLSQLSREVERSKREPILSDLRDSGAIEQDADVVVFLHRPVMSDDQAEFDEVKLIVAKHRSGPLSRIPLVFEKAKTLFFEEKKATPEPYPGSRGYKE